MDNLTIPIWKRPLDILLVFLFTAYSFTWLTFDIPTTLGRPKSERDRKFLEKTSPLWLNPPPFMRFLLGLVAFLYGPCFPILIYGLIRNRSWVSQLGKFLSGLLTITNSLLFFKELTSATPPPNKPLFFASNGPYFLAVFLLAYRSLKKAK